MTSNGDENFWEWTFRIPSSSEFVIYGPGETIDGTEGQKTTFESYLLAKTTCFSQFMEHLGIVFETNIIVIM